MACKTCSEPISSKCISWQGKDLKITPTLTNKKDFEEIVIKLDSEISGIKTEIHQPIDKKWIESNPVTQADYIQALIDKVAVLSVNTTEQVTPTLNIENTCLSDCGKTSVTYDEAMILILQELCSIKTKLNNTTNTIYLPNV